MGTSAKRRLIHVAAVIVLLLVGSSLPAAGASVSIPRKYTDAARIMGDWLVDHIDPVLISWATPWDLGRTDSTISFYGVKQLAMLSGITGDSVYRDAAQRVADSWISKAFIRSQDEVAEWTWAYDGKIGKLTWTDDEFAKARGAFVSGVWAEKDGHEWVRSAEVPFCAGVVKPLSALLALGGEYSEEIDLLAGWLRSDLVHKKPCSGDSPFCAYMTCQTYTDPDGDGSVDIDYILWGSRRQSAGMNARFIPVLLALGMKDEAIQTADWLINVMWNKDKGRFNAVYDFETGVSFCLEGAGDEGCVNGQIARGLLAVYQATHDRKYLDYATDALDWVVDHETASAVTGSGIQVYFTKPAVYGTHQVVSAMADAFKVTGQHKYLVYAVAGADWLIGQMETPFQGYENNPWSVVETLEAMEALIGVGTDAGVSR